MAGDWIKMRCNLDSDPRVMRMACALNTTELHVVGLLWKFWTWADAHTLDGNAASVTEKMIDRFTCDQFALQLRECGWLESSASGLKIPNFEQHNGQSAKARALTQVRVKRHRNADTVTETLPEKRREEKRDNTDPVPPAAKPDSKQEGATDPRHHEITSVWSERFKRGNGAEYTFNAKDAATLKRFLQTYSGTSGAFLDTAESAWLRFRNDRFAKNCSKAATIHGLCTFFNDITVELLSPKQDKEPRRQSEFADRF